MRANLNRDLGGGPLHGDREKLALGVCSGDPDHTLRYEAEAAGTLSPEEFFTGPGTRAEK